MPSKDTLAAACLCTQSCTRPDQFSFASAGPATSSINLSRVNTYFRPILKHTVFFTRLVTHTTLYYSSHPTCFYILQAMKCWAKSWGRHLVSSVCLYSSILFLYHRFVPMIPTQALFLVFSFLPRIVEGAGTAMFSTASYAQLTEFYPDKKGTIVVSDTTTISRF